jgi:hypothetical protein
VQAVLPLAEILMGDLPGAHVNGSFRVCGLGSKPKLVIPRRRNRIVGIVNCIAKSCGQIIYEYID